MAFGRILVVFWPNFPIKDKGTYAEIVLFLYFSPIRAFEFSKHFVLIWFNKFFVSF